MVDTARIKRLRAMAAKLERRPHSNDRDTLLREMRARIVALETEGLEPRTVWRPAAPGASRLALERRLLGMS